MSKDNTLINYQFSIANAEGFYATGKFNAAQSQKDAKNGYAWIPVGVVNFSFAVELLLKATLFYDLRKKHQGHKLFDLYQKLSDNSKIKIETSYKKYLLQNASNNNLPDYKIVINKKGENKTEKSDIDFSDIITMLKIHSESFENWRYLHEFHNGLNYHFNFKAIDAFYKALKEILTFFLISEKRNFGMGSVAY